MSQLPEGKPAGYRVILTGSEPAVMEKQTDGSWLPDTDFGIGTTAAIVGVNGDKAETARYIKAETVLEAKTPFFGSGNNMEVLFGVIWNDRLVVIRTYNGDYDMIIIFENGETIKSDPFKEVPTGAVVDSLFNLWIATDHGLTKFRYSDPETPITYYKPSDGSMPFDKIKYIAAYGKEIWVVQNETSDFKIAHYNGFTWEDLTAQFMDDLSFGTEEKTGMVARDIFVDGDGLVIIALSGTNFSSKLFTYNGTVFAAKSIPGTPTYIDDIIKIGDFAYMLDNTAYPKVFKWSTATLLSTYSVVCNGLCTNGSEVIAYSDTEFARVDAGSSVFVKDTATFAQIMSITENGMVLQHMAITLTKRLYLNSDSSYFILRGDLVDQWRNI